MLSERAWLEYRLDVVRSWPQGTRREVAIGANTGKDSGD